MIDRSRRALRRSALVAGLAVIVVTLAIFAFRSEVSDQKPLNEPAVLDSAVPDAIADPSPVHRTETQSPRTLMCTGQSVDLTIDRESTTLCFGETSTVQNGSIRTYRFDSAEGSERSLRIEASGNAILATSLRVGSASFACKAEDCKGVRIGKRDAEGRRTIALKQAALMRLDSPTAVAQVTGTIKTLAEDQVPGLACTGQGLSIITSDGSAIAFCPKGGAGFEIGDNGNTTYRFTSLENESVLVMVDSSHHVQRVEYHGDTVFACKSADCGQVDVGAPNAAGERVFSFGGTSVMESGTGQNNAVLNGTLIVPPL